jgi:hypothetical protein
MKDRPAMPQPYFTKDLLAPLGNDPSDGSSFGGDALAALARLFPPDASGRGAPVGNAAAPGALWLLGNASPYSQGGGPATDGTDAAEPDLIGHLRAYIAYVDGLRPLTAAGPSAMPPVDGSEGAAATRAASAGAADPAGLAQPGTGAGSDGSSATEGSALSAPSDGPQRTREDPQGATGVTGVFDR